MKITMKLSNKFIELTISGITIVLNPNNLMEGLKTMKSFYDSIIPQERKDTLIGSGIEEAFDNMEKFEPFIKNVLECLTLEKAVTAEMSFNEDGSIGMSSSDLSGSFNTVKFMQTISDISTFISEEKDARAAKRKAHKDEFSKPFNFDEKVHDDLIEKDELVKTFIKPGATIGQLLTSLAAHELIVGNIRNILIDLNIDDKLSHHLLETVNTELEQHGYEYAFDEVAEDINEIAEDINEIEFNSRPTNKQVLEAINAHLSTEISWLSLHTDFFKETGIALNPNSSASTSTCINACKIYGIDAVCSFNKPAYNEEETE